MITKSFLLAALTLYLALFGYSLGAVATSRLRRGAVITPRLFDVAAVAGGIALLIVNPGLAGPLEAFAAATLAGALIQLIWPAAVHRVQPQ